MSIPLAAISVATSMRTDPALKFARAFVLAPWLLFPCIAHELIPSFSS